MRDSKRGVERRPMEKQGEEKRREKTSSYFDYNLLFLIIFLVCFGLVMLYSSSSYIAANSALFNYDGAYYLKKQLRNIAIGAVGMIALIFIDYRFWRKLSVLAYLGSFALCIAVFFIGSDSHGSTRWIDLGPISFQPSEIAKIGIILFLAMTLEKVAKNLKSGWNLIKVLLLVAPVIAAVAVSNLSTAVILAGIAVCMLFVASPKYWHFFFVGGAGVLFVALFIAFAGYRMGRIEAWLNPEAAGDGAYQTLQGLYAIGSGGLFGKGLGESLQKLGNVPESQNDMIFTIICEELGLFGAVSVILLFLLLIWRMMIIANNAKDLYGSLIVVGVMSHVAIQVILNIAVVTNSIPNTGVILPFISYGGTSFIFLLCEMGLVLSVSRGIKLEAIK